MKKSYLFGILLLFYFQQSNARHITGGEMSYVLLTQNGNNYTYAVTLKLFRDCYSNGPQLDAAASIGIFENNGTNNLVWSDYIIRGEYQVLQINHPDPCINNPPLVCYEIGYYQFNVTLPASPTGYVITYQTCCRITGINNLLGSGSTGATYTAIIPGTNPVSSGPHNSSAVFTGSDTVIVCGNNYFEYDFGAHDPDGDSLSYTFCNAYVGSNPGANPPPPPPPPYYSVNYAPDFSESSPLGNKVRIKAQSGFISGIAPAAGIYVVTVCVNEFREGQLIAFQRKDLQIKVGDCNAIQATLNEEYPVCDSYTTSFLNQTPTGVLKYFWDFGVPDRSDDTSALSNPAFTYPDTGIYILRLFVNRGLPCADSTSALVKVYPGFFPAFNYKSLCVNKPTFFTDSSRTRYGTIDSWSWDFGQGFISTDSSSARNPVYTYNQQGNFFVTLNVTNSKGCIATITKPLDITDKAQLDLAFKDTVICKGDILKLHAIGNGIYKWTPDNNITGGNTAEPEVNPAVSSKYYVTLDDNGCINTDTVQVRVVDFVSLQAFRDTTVCLTDTIRLNANTNGLKFLWGPSATLLETDVKSPRAIPSSGITTYSITASIGGCSATDDLRVNAIPYPVADAGPDMVLCFNTSGQLDAHITGKQFTWKPLSGLSNPDVLDPFVTPGTGTAYVLTVTDDLGCPKLSTDTVLVRVQPKMAVSSDGDTSVVVDQPLQLHAEGGISYLWTPSTGLNKSNISSPIGIYDGSFEKIKYKIYIQDQYECLDSTYVTVNIFKSGPKIFVPSAFTPNGDGKNDRFTFVPAGLLKVEYFKVFNRWGKLVYSSTSASPGWDGRIAGEEQGSGVYVWIARGVDFKGQLVEDKGTVTLIR
jgi:gliding motility-associated-like protein